MDAHPLKLKVRSYVAETPFIRSLVFGVEDGDLPAGTDCATLARYTATVLGGLAVQAPSGATEKELRLVAALAMQAWPS